MILPAHELSVACAVAKQKLQSLIGITGQTLPARFCMADMTGALNTFLECVTASAIVSASSSASDSDNASNIDMTYKLQKYFCMKKYSKSCKRMGIKNNLICSNNLENCVSGSS